ncbi:MAG: Hpt domain-containing protein [Bariatricus sp.]
MTIQECYQKLGGDYEAVLKRLMSPNLVHKFIGRFLEDDSIKKLCEGMDAGNREEAFRAAHTLKGVCQNLGIGTLAASTEKITEVLRKEQEMIPEEAAALLEDVKRDYQEAADTIRVYLASES